MIHQKKGLVPFWDDYMIDKSVTTASLSVNKPTKTDVLMRFDNAWDGNGNDFFTIIKEDGFDDVTEADIRDFCIGSIARYKVPKYVFFVDEFPLTTSGKIQKYKLGDLGLELLDERRKNGEL